MNVELYSIMRHHVEYKQLEEEVEVQMVLAVIRLIDRFLLIHGSQDHLQSGNAREDRFSEHPSLHFLFHQKDLSFMLGRVCFTRLLIIVDIVHAEGTIN